MKKFFSPWLNLIILFSLLINVPELFSQKWTKLSGTSLYLNGIFLSSKNPQLIMVSSDDIPTDFSKQDINFPYFGVGQNGFRISTNGGSTFSDPILSGYSVYNLHQSALDDKVWFASVRKFNRGGILISSDGGYSWNTEDLKCPGNFQITKIISKKNDADKLAIFASAANTDEGFRYSYDNFDECLTNQDLDIQSLDIAISPLDKNLIFIAGDGFHNNGVYRSYDNGKTWLKDSSGLNNKRVLCVLPSAYDKAWVLCGVDSIDLNKYRYGKGIYLSQDTGKTWKPVGAFGSTVFSLAQHPLYPKFIAAACDKQGVYLSGSFGWSWENFSDGLPKDSSVRQVAIPEIDSTKEGIIVYAGVFGDGLYKSGRIKTEIENPDALINDFSIFPNPARDYIEIQDINAEQVNPKQDIKIYNLLGECNLVEQTSLFVQKFDISNLPPGIYFVRLGNRVGRFIKIWN